MARATSVVAAAAVDGRRVVDSVVLDHAGRRVQRGTLTAASGATVVVELPDPVMLRMGDALALEGGGLIEVVAEPEALIEVRAADVTALARLAWHLGDRHVPLQVLPNRLRLRRDAGIEAMLDALGARLTPIEAPFDPEGGAYLVAAAGDARHDHGHHHHCGHDHHHHGDHGDHSGHSHGHHDHGHHDHDPGCGCGGGHRHAGRHSDH